MAGTIFGLGLAQQVDENGEPRSGCLLYLYEAGTSTPVTTYKDFALTTGNEHTWPIVADAEGRIPAFWVDDGSYRVRLTTSGGTTIFDETTITAIGASSGSSGSGGGVSTEATFVTGHCLFSFDSSIEGFVKLNGRTIGNAASGATERANADTEALFAFLWDQLADSEAAVSGGRGASAAADFAASKTITLPDMRGKAAVGTDDMGANDASVIGSTVRGLVNAVTTLAMTTANLPAHNHAPGTFGVGGNGARIQYKAFGISTGSDSTVYSLWGSVIGEGAPDSTARYSLGGADTTVNSTAGDPAASSNGFLRSTGLSATEGSTTSIDMATYVPYCLGFWFIKL